MTPWLKWVYLVVLAVWLGSIVFFSFITAPAVFRALDPENAGKVIRAIFPRYYLLGILCAALGIICVPLLLAQHAWRIPEVLLSLLLLAGMGALNLWMRQAVAPQMNDIRMQLAHTRAAGREPTPELEAEWKSLHRLSVQVNAAVLTGALVLLFLVVYARVV